MTRASVHILALLALLSASPSGSAQAQEIQIVDYGIYTARGDKVFQDLKSPTGRRRSLEVDLVKQTDVIPAVLNTKFGFRFKVLGVPDGTTVHLRLKFDYPEMTNPTTRKVSSSYEALGNCPVGSNLLGMFWDFVHPWEMRAGKWTMSIYSGDRLLAQRSLIVVKGEEGGDGRTKPKPKDGKPDGAANGSQPSRTETSSTSSAAGSRR